MRSMFDWPLERRESVREGEWHPQRGHRVNLQSKTGRMD